MAKTMANAATRTMVLGTSTDTSWFSKAGE